jgi:hypothetical protein
LSLSDRILVFCDDEYSHLCGDDPCGQRARNQLLVDA